LDRKQLEEQFRQNGIRILNLEQENQLLKKTTALKISSEMAEQVLKHSNSHGVYNLSYHEELKKRVSFLEDALQSKRNENIAFEKKKMNEIIELKNDIKSKLL